MVSFRSCLTGIGTLIQNIDCRSKSAMSALESVWGHEKKLRG